MSTWWRRIVRLLRSRRSPRKKAIEYLQGILAHSVAAREQASIEAQEQAIEATDTAHRVLEMCDEVVQTLKRIRINR